MGPRSAKIALVGEAFGDTEAQTGLPFMGASGQELTRMLSEVGLARGDCFLTNTFAFQPGGGNIESLCLKKAELPPGYSHKALSLGKYLAPQYFDELTRLKEELEVVKPNLVIALGNVACWALLGSAGITTLRGTVTESSLCPTQKTLPTYHPSAVLRNWSLRPIVLADLMKARRESAFPSIQRPVRHVLTDPSLDEIADWYRGSGNVENAPLIAVDIETTRGQIDCVGFAVSHSKALCIPFVSPAGGVNYWPSVAEEIQAWMWVQKILLSPGKKVLQNGLYDIQYLLRHGLRLHNFAEDTMLLHHALFPEMQKGLGFLGSIYTNESSWKLLNRGLHDDLKKDA
jgi:DNA polymerase